MTKHLMQLANKRGYALSWNVHGQALTRAKEQLCYVALDHAAETKVRACGPCCLIALLNCAWEITSSKLSTFCFPFKLPALLPSLQLARETTVGVTSYVLPDGESIRLGSERFEAPEVLFRPQNAGLECLTGLGGLVDSAIGACDMDLRRSMYASIILSGGGSLFPGLAPRLAAELQNLHLARCTAHEAGGIGRKLKIKVDDAPRRMHLVSFGTGARGLIMYLRYVTAATRFIAGVPRSGGVGGNYERSKRILGYKTRMGRGSL